MNSNLLKVLNLRKIFGLILLIESILSDCGLPAVPPNAKIHSFEFIYPENYQVEYYCELPELVLLNGKTRICKNGKWVGSIPFCAEEIGENSIERIQVNYGKNSRNYSDPKGKDGKALSGYYERGQCLKGSTTLSNTTTFQIIFRRIHSHISYFEIVLQTDTLISNSSKLVSETILNSVRICDLSIDNQSVSSQTKPSYLVHLKFLCDFVSNTEDETDYMYYSNDITKNITLKFNPKIISLCEMRVFYQRFTSPNRCGSPDTPLHSSVDLVQMGSKYGATPSYHFTCDTNFQVIGNQDVRCGVNNYWMDAFPVCVPIVKCPLFEGSFDQLISIKAFYVDFYNIDGNDIPIPGSQIIYTCDESQNSSKVMIGDSVRICTQSGKWSGIQPYCMDLAELKFDRYNEIFNESESEPLSLSRNQTEVNDCGFPAIPIYAKPSPSRYLLEDFRSHYPNGTKIQFRCESSFNFMNTQTKARICIERKWTGGVGKCEINYGRKVELISISVKNGHRIKSIWWRPQTNQTQTTIDYDYEGNAFDNWDGSKCAPLNMTAKQQLILKLNDTQPISSLMIEINPGGLYGGLNNYGLTKNITKRPLVVKVGSNICKSDTILDYPPHSTHIIFICDELNSNEDYSHSIGFDEIAIYVNPNQFDKQFDGNNTSLCSLTLFHSSEDCGIPDRPLNSIVTIVNKIAYYSCEEGYELIGSSSVMCLSNGKWAQEFPVCKLKLDLCPRVLHKQSVLCHYINLGKDKRIIMGTLVRCECAHILTNFEGKPLLVGSRTRICMKNSEWSGSTPFCVDSNQYKSTAYSLTFSRKALIIMFIVLISSIIVILLIILIVCNHLTQKCYQCFSLCFNSNKCEANENTIPITCRSESKIIIEEINETLKNLASFTNNEQQTSA